MAEEPKKKRAKTSGDFSGQVCIVTGGTTGIGAACCQLFKDGGADVYNIDVSTPKDAGFPTRLCDVSDTKKLKSTIAGILKETKGRVDHLIVSAGVHLFQDVENASEAEYDRVTGINLRGTFFAIQAVIPAMRERKQGSIVVIGSDQSLIGKEGQAIYGMTKGAQAQLVKSTAVQYAKVGIRVNCICPGTIDTPLVDGAINALMKQNPDTTEAHWRKVLDEAQPIHRLGRPEEIAQAVIMCATNGFMTGALVSVDGGYVAQ
eukprot:gb/GEZN01012946.1/.p1 GENE.gb/GEZN01012946.1/~~gb/GEZN01012946.1/.p1  ORF type:complete len:261 (-),score=37.24 gb/GEZN01012946.1/:219-1001(-)